MEAFKLRKKVFGDELNDSRFIVEDKYFIDPWDVADAKLLIVKEKRESDRNI